MEDPSQEMEALKKVYAEMVLNTAKEAAARTMASERKALRLQRELSDTKDEALRLLLRFKNMIDVKTTEAETTSLGQKKRIEELDSQLNKTEEVIIDLRSEIRKAREQLEQVKNSHMLQSDGPTENKHVHQEKNAHTKKLDVTEQLRCDRNSNPAKETAKSGPHSGNVLDSDTDLMSIDIGSKAIELYRNGYTHRIRAIERNLVNVKSFSEDKPSEDFNARHNLVMNVDEEKRGICAPSSMVADNIDVHTDAKYINLSDALSINSSVAKDNVLDSDTDLMSIDIGSKAIELYRNGYTHRIRAIERNLVNGKSISEDKPSEDINARNNLVMNVDEEKRGICAPSSMVADNIDVHTDAKYINLSDALSINSSAAEDQTIMTKRLEVNSCRKDEQLAESSEQSECPLRRSIRKRKARCWDEISSLFKSRSALSRCKKSASNDPVKIETHQHRSKSLSPSTGASKEITYDVKDTKLLSESVVKKQEFDAKESAVVACDTNGNSSLKYKFSRSRNKILSPKIDLTCQMKEKPSSSPDNKNRNLIEDTSSDIHNMVDIACQLISLSGSRSL